MKDFDRLLDTTFAKKGRSGGIFTDDFRGALSSLAEGRSKFNGSVVSAIAEMTDRNDHTEALIAGARMLGYKHIVDKLEMVKKLQSLEGHLPHPLSTYRYDLYKQLMERAKKDLTPDQYKRFYGAY